MVTARQGSALECLQFDHKSQQWENISAIWLAPHHHRKAAISSWPVVIFLFILAGCELRFDNFMITIVVSSFALYFFLQRLMLHGNCHNANII